MNPTLVLPLLVNFICFFVLAILLIIGGKPNDPLTRSDAMGLLIVLALRMLFLGSLP